MKQVLFIFLLLAATSVQAEEFVYVDQLGRIYEPEPDAVQPAVRIVETTWGYDLHTGDDAEVCIVRVEPLRGGDTEVTPPESSFMILDGVTYLLQTEFESKISCDFVGM